MPRVAVGDKAGQRMCWSAILYRAKVFTHLKKWNMGLEHAVDFGYCVFGKWALKALCSYNVSKNYGWSIILLTMILQVLLLPLSIKITSPWPG